MKGQDLTKENDIQFHLKGDWRTAHGIWNGVQDYLDRNMLRLNWKATPQLLTLVNDGAWHDLDVTGYTSDNCRAVILAVRWTTGGRWANLYTRLNGSSADYEGIAAFSYITSEAAGHTHDVKGDDVGKQILQKVDTDGIFEYKLSKEGTVDVYLIGYFDAGATGGSLSPYLSPHTHPGTDVTSQVGDADTVDGQHAAAFEQIANKNTPSGYCGLDGDSLVPLARIPAHHARHESGGSDAVKLDDLAAPDNNADLDASPDKHGLEAKGTGKVYDVRLGNNTWGRYLRKTFVQLEDEFVGGSAMSGEAGIGELGWRFIYTGSGGEVTSAPLATLDENHIGVENIKTANSAGAHSGIYSRGSITPSRSLIPPSIDEVEFIIQIPTITECVVRIGLFEQLAQNVGGGSDTCSAWFDYDSSVGGNWYASSCGTIYDPGTTDTGIACVAGNWYVLKIKRVSSAQWDFYINDALVVSRTTKLPSEDKGMNPGYWVKTLKVASVYIRELYADYFRILSPVMPGNRYTS